MNTTQMNVLRNLEIEHKAKDVRLVDENLQGEPIILMTCEGTPQIREFVIGKKGDYEQTMTYAPNIQLSALMAASPRPKGSK